MWEDSREHPAVSGGLGAHSRAAGVARAEEPRPSGLKAAAETRSAQAWELQHQEKYKVETGAPRL